MVVRTHLETFNNNNNNNNLLNTMFFVVVSEGFECAS